MCYFKLNNKYPVTVESMYCFNSTVNVFFM